MAREAPPLPPDLQPPRVLAPEPAPIARPLGGAGAATGSSRRTWLLLSLGTLATGSLGYLFVAQGAPVAAGALALFSSMALVLWCVIRVLG
jgi:hypothetical protein